MGSKGHRDRTSSVDSGKRQAELLEDTRSTAVLAIVDALAGIHRSRSEVVAPREGRSSPGDGPPRVEIGNASSATDLLYDLARLQLDLFKRVLAFQREHSETLFGSLARSRAQASEASLLVVRWPLDSGSGALRNRARPTSFCVENRGSKCAHVVLRVSPLMSRGDSAERLVFREADAEFSENDFELQPDEERVITLRLRRSEQRIRPGLRYRGCVEIRMAARPKLELPLRLDVTRLSPRGPGT